MATLDYKELLALAYRVAKSSVDPSTQNGAILIQSDGSVRAMGCNRLPDNIASKPERWERPLKYKVVEHAERNVIYKAARYGIATDGLIMVCPWAPCTDCARAIIQSGIKKLITHKQAYDRSPDSWRVDIDLALSMLAEASIDVLMFDGFVGVPSLRHSGQVWNP